MLWFIWIFILFLYQFLLRPHTSEHSLEYLLWHAYYSLKNRRYSNQTIVRNLNNVRHAVSRHYSKKGNV
jgi:hypothetical protein